MGVSVVFSAHMGTTKQRIHAAGEMVGISPDRMNEVLGTKMTSSKTSALYKFNMGYVKDLRTALNIPAKFHDNMIVSKIGRSKDLNLRAKQHQHNYRDSLDIEEIVLSYHEAIHPDYLAEAETMLLKLVVEGGFKLKNPDYTEIIIHSKSDTQAIKNIFKEVSDKFPQHITKERVKTMKAKHIAQTAELKMQYMETIHELERTIHELRLNDLKKDNKILKLQNTQ